MSAIEAGPELARSNLPLTLVVTTDNGWSTNPPAPRSDDSVVVALPRPGVGRDRDSGPGVTVRPMGVDRIVPNLRVADVGRAHRLYAEVFDLSVGMDLGWVGNLRAADTAAAQLQVMTQAAGLEVVHSLTDEEWGVRRLFFRDPDGNVVNVVAHR